MVYLTLKSRYVWFQIACFKLLYQTFPPNYHCMVESDRGQSFLGSSPSFLQTAFSILAHLLLLLHPCFPHTGILSFPLLSAPISTSHSRNLYAQLFLLFGEEWLDCSSGRFWMKTGSLLSHHQDLILKFLLDPPSAVPTTSSKTHKYIVSWSDITYIRFCRMLFRMVFPSPTFCLIFTPIAD